MAQLEELHKTYFKTRHTASVTKIGLLLEAALSLYVAEVNRAAGNDARARALVAFAVDSHPGHAALRNYEASLPAELVEIDWAHILLPARPNDEGPAVDPAPAA